MQKKRKPKREALERSAPGQLQDSPIIGMFRTVARDPKITVDKLRELVLLQERIVDREAAVAFGIAYQLMMPELPRITKRGIIKNKQGEVQSRYSKYEDIRKVTDPILRQFGFVIHYSTSYPAPGIPMVTGTLTHTAGGTKVSQFQAAPDDSGGKNRIQGIGSAISYGKRYVRKDLLQIVEEGEDDDAQSAGKAAGGRSRPQQAATPAAAEIVNQAPAAHHGQASEPITGIQRRRLVALVQNSGRSENEVRDYLKRRGFASTADIPRDQYESICSAIEARGDLPK